MSFVIFCVIFFRVILSCVIRHETRPNEELPIFGNFKISITEITKNKFFDFSLSNLFRIFSFI